jgi:hypothetical protein
MNVMEKWTLAALVLLGAIVLAVPAQNQNKTDNDKIVGIWALEVNADGEYYFLTLELKVTDDKLAGGLSEQNGMFTNVPLTNIEFDGQTLKFDCKVPTPPDGSERVTKTEMKLADNNKLEGTITVEEMGLSAPITGTKK